MIRTLKENNVGCSDNLTDGNAVMTSLCPKLGKMYAEVIKGPCPSHMQQLFGKTLKISFTGLPPYIIYNPLGGSEFAITKLLAKKFGFVPKYIPAKVFDTVWQNNKTTYGLIHQVIF